MRYYKILTKRGNRGGFGKFKWDISGKWMSVEGKLKMCKNGFHVIKKRYICDWINAISRYVLFTTAYTLYNYAKKYLKLYEVEIKGDRIRSYNKICVRSVRVIKKLEWEDYLK